MPITLLVRMVTAIGVMKGETENVNLHGAFIRCQKPLEPGERLFVIAKLPSKPSFNFHAEVVWSRVSRPNDGGTSPGMRVNPNVAYPRRGKPRQSAPNVGARRLGQDEQYLTVREILSEMARYHASAVIFTGLGMQR
jgi:hypothetical protein